MFTLKCIALIATTISPMPEAIEEIEDVVFSAEDLEVLEKLEDLAFEIEEIEEAVEVVFCDGEE